MKKILIYGAGGFGREVHSLVQQINSRVMTYEFIGYIDDGVKKGTMVNDYPVLGTGEDLNNWKEEIFVVLAIGEPKTKKKIAARLTNPLIRYPVLIHPGSIIGDMNFNTIGEGSIICAGNIITVNTKIGRHVLLNLACTVGHDVVIGDFCSVMPGVNISGEVVIEENVYVGTGAKIINQLTVGRNSIIGSGAVVTKDIPSNCTAVGIPAKPVKFNE